MSPDGRSLYHTDTLERVIYAFDLAPRWRRSRTSRVFTQIGAAMAIRTARCVGLEGLSSGPASSAAGASTAIRRDGRVDRKLALPVRERHQAGVRRHGPAHALHHDRMERPLEATDRAKQPLAGGLFRARVDVPGRLKASISHGL